MIARLVFLLVIVFYHTSDAQTPSCPAGFTGDAATGLCYLASSTHSTFDDSVSNCAQFRSRLPSVLNNPVQALLTRVAMQVDRDYLWYIGLKRVSGNVFAWIDGSPYNYTSWQANQPATGLGLDCVANFPQVGQTGWRVTPCTDTLPYICVITAVNTTTTMGTGTQTQTTTTPGNPNTCPPANYQGPTGTITSPGFPAQYGDNLNCQYKITVASGQYVLLTVNSFSTEACCDFLTLYDGPDTSSPQIAQLKGVIPAGRQYESTTNVLNAIFSSDSSVGASGFSIQYSQTSATLPPMTTPPVPQCPSVNFTGPSGSIASPGYPGQYANNMNCDYYISVAQNMGVQITFDVFSTEDSYDIVTVYDGTGPLANELDELSGTSGQGKTYTSTVNSMRVNFQSDSSNVDIGFHANYLQVIPPSTIPTTTTTLQPPTTPSAKCGRDWYFDSAKNKCYHYDYNKLSFADAQTACRGNNSELISIHSAAQENATASYIVYATTGSERFYTWVGLMAVQGQFTRWTDGTPVDYTAWESGQPSLTIGQCAVIQAWAQEDKASGWRSLDCAYQRPYICQRNPLN